ncbi:uncharacterized protein BX663DRAFT_465276 [Cokeromyces recurvatus]|uniref:uncharacterized protein n=1 Tax=Cokeromyces recurvatus TaxID=90255 RepID=UPI00221FB6B5|nr:uncharacterized protein BX663DRAFT_465276 [Cokeromyces recurvatus]KAI7906957.1 hypothetical protein BX663DRAFT_465276 [Cokeromyces recurvatus]
MSFSRESLTEDVSKKSKGIISRMKRSFSTSDSRPQLNSTIANNIIEGKENRSSSTDTIIQHGFTVNSNSLPINSTSSSPIPAAFKIYQNKGDNVNYFSALSTRTLCYEASNSSTFNLSTQFSPFLIKSNSNSSQLNDDTPHSLTVTSQKKGDRKNISTVNEELQAKSIFERKIASITSDNDKVGYAPTPAMYWSRPEVYGIKPSCVRAHASVVYGDKMYVYGGMNNNSVCSDKLYVLELDTFTWSIPKVFGTLPPPCRAHSLTVDPNNGKIYLFGGGDGQIYYNHLYVLDIYTMTWSQLKTNKSLSDRRAHSTIIWNEGLYVFGGGNGTNALNDMYRFDLKTEEWTEIKTINNTTARGYHSGTVVNDKLIIFGGNDGKRCLRDFHILDLESLVWEHMEDIGIPSFAHSAICLGSFLFIIAGRNERQYSNNLLMLNLVNMNWETKIIYGQAPSPRGYHTSVLHDSRIILFAGYDGSVFLNDIHILDLSSYSYLPQITNFTINMHKKNGVCI